VSTEINIAVIQCALPGPLERNLETIVAFCHEAAAAGANIILPPELFEGPYFCQTQDEAFFAHASRLEDCRSVRVLSQLAQQLNVVIPTSFFEKDGPHYYNSLALIDADGTVLGTYRKSHIPDGPGYQEKYYFRPGNTGFRVWSTRFGTVGVGICWDQWFPECARAMALMGAEVLLYPSAIGSEPAQPELETRKPWQRVMIGHAVANAMPVAACNRIGREDAMTFYGHSFICNAQGEILTELDAQTSGVALATFNRADLERYRASFGFFRDRRPDLYNGTL